MMKNDGRRSTPPKRAHGAAVSEIVSTLTSARDDGHRPSGSSAREAKEATDAGNVEAGADQGADQGDDKSARFAEMVQRLATGYKTISEMVYEVLKEAIISGAFAPGEWLRQESLASAIGVSRIPVRTALIQLESDGLVEFHPHRGARVCTLTSAQIKEIFRLRELLEMYALRRCMTEMTPLRIAELKALAQQLDTQPEGSHFLDARIRFYSALYDVQHNPLLVQMIEELRNHLGRYLLGLRLDHHHPHHQHVEFVEYVAAGDLASAESWLKAHLADVREGLEALALDSRADAEPGNPDDGVRRPAARRFGRRMA